MRAYYSADHAGFFADTDMHILGELARWHQHDLEAGQKAAWLKTIEILRWALRDLDAFTLYLEFAIPRMGKRADAVLVVGESIFVIEFKVGSATFDRYAIEQVEDYALDLKNFHLGSHDRNIVPILVPTLAPRSHDIQMELALDQVAAPLLLCPEDLAPVVALIAQRPTATIDAKAWAASGYRPTPTIIEAARTLYARHDVKDIARSDADAVNLTRTQDAISRIIDGAKRDDRKAVVFITGVPGAGKTLAGLNITTQRSDRSGGEHATFLSGNGPLVDVLREALTRDQHARLGGTKSHIERQVKAFIQNIHSFRDQYAGNDDVPSDHIVVFDEAQRAWTRRKAAKFMQQKRGVHDFDMSEPEFLLSIMDRHPGWCTVICLVGGGQEINDGEAGLSEWMAAVRDHFPHWRVFASDHIVQSDYNLNNDARAFLHLPQVALDDSLHLAVSMRSFRAETLSDFVSRMLDGHAAEARTAFMRLNGKYPIVVTRDLNQARQWLRDKARGSERYGLVASSGAHRLRPEGLHVKAGIDPPNWFLNGRDDVRSSFYLEDVASEFDVQGLELDWTAVCWDADLRFDQGWSGWTFKGTRWQRVADTWRRLYLTNAYRVILTRARQGMVIFVPRGDEADATRPPDFYDGTWKYLTDCGLPELDH